MKGGKVYKSQQTHFLF